MLEALEINQLPKMQLAGRLSDVYWADQVAGDSVFAHPDGRWP